MGMLTIPGRPGGYSNDLERITSCKRCRIRHPRHVASCSAQLLPAPTSAAMTYLLNWIYSAITNLKDGTALLEMLIVVPLLPWGLLGG